MRSVLILVPLLAACSFDRSGVPAWLEAGASDARGSEGFVSFDATTDRVASLDGMAVDQGPTDAVHGDGPAQDQIVPPPGWWDSAWKTRRKLTFQNAARNVDLIDFPVLLVLDATRVTYGAVGPGGKDLRFVDADNKTTLPHQIELFQAGGTSYIWVRVPQIDKASNTDHIWLYHGNPGAPDGQQAEQVWNQDYVGVWHLAGDVKDSTVNHHHGTNNGAQNTGGVVAGALQFSGQQYLELPNTAALKLDVFTVSLWFRTSQSWDTAGFPGSGMLITRATGGWCSHDWVIYGGSKSGDSGDAGRVALQTGACTGTGWEPNAQTAKGFNDGKPHHLVYARTAQGNNTIYLDGSQAAAAADDGSAVAADRPIQVGGEQYHSGGSYLTGAIDEVRIAKGVRPAEWIDAQHASMSDKLVIYGPEQTYP